MSDDLSTDPVVAYLARQYQRKDRFVHGFRLRELLEGDVDRRAAHLEMLVQRGALERFSTVDQYWLTLFGLVSSDIGAVEKVLLNALLDALRLERRRNRAFDQFGRATLDHHAACFNHVTFPEGIESKPDYAYAGLYLLGVVQAPLGGDGRWTLNFERLERVLDAADVDDLLARDGYGSEPQVPEGAPRILYLLPDTNVFIQCRALEDIDWSKCGEFDEVILIVCRPVQREIEAQKNGRDRVGRRARRAHGVFRKALRESTNELIVSRPGKRPLVKLRVDLKCGPTLGLADLEYDKSDDVIVACGYGFVRRHPSAEFKVLSDDGGVIGTSKMLNVPQMDIPEDWWAPPEATEHEKEIAALKLEVQRLQKSEPEVHMHCETRAGERVETISGSINSYRPLHDAELDKLVDILVEKFPCVTDFDEPSAPGIGGAANKVLGISRRYQRPSARAIAEYSRSLYPRWLETCRETLSRVHTAANLPGRAVYRFSAQNMGTRPGRDARVTIKASGKFKLRTLESGDASVAALALPGPPDAPEGTWMMDVLGITAHPETLKSLMAGDGLFAGERGFSLSEVPSAEIPQFDFRDPNRFHWKPERSTECVKELTLECEQWRHASDAEYFEFEIVPDLGVARVEGALCCRIEAENLSTPVSETVPVRLSVVAADPCEQAFDLVDLLEPVLSVHVVE